MKNTEISGRVNNGNKYMEKFSDISKLEYNFETVNNKVNKLIKLHEHFKVQIHLEKNIKLYEDELNKLIDDNNKIVAKYTELLQEASICPFCFNELDKEHIDKIIEEYEV